MVLKFKGIYKFHLSVMAKQVYHLENFYNFAFLHHRHNILFYLKLYSVSSLKALTVWTNESNYFLFLLFFLKSSMKRKLLMFHFFLRTHNLQWPFRELILLTRRFQYSQLFQICLNTLLYTNENHIISFLVLNSCHCLFFFLLKLATFLISVSM